MNLRNWLLNLVSPILTDRELSQIEAQSVVEGEAIAEAKVRGLQTGFGNVLDRYESEFRNVIEVEPIREIAVSRTTRKLPSKASVKSRRTK